MGVARRVRHIAPSVCRAAVALALLALLPAAAQAQEGYISDAAFERADSLFTLGVNSYEGARYDEALSFFERVLDNFPVNRTTTAARLMAARSAYQAEEYERAVDLTESFAEAYPTSGYVEAAETVLELARRAIRIRESTPLPLGVVLSLGAQQVAASQEMYNGIRLAVDDHNRLHPDRPVRIVFRDTGDSRGGVRTVMQELDREDVTTVIGTLFSEDALAAAEQAESRRMLFVAPLATDERVSAGRRYVFQANPSIRLRGELMARFAVNGLLIDRLGVIAQETPEGVGTTLSDAFLEQASAMGAEINLVTLVPDEQSWSNLDRVITSDTLSHVDALYIPLVTDDPVRLTGAVLSSMDRLGRSVRILGNSTWHDLPMRADAGKYTTTYSNDFNPDDDRPVVRRFRERYRILAGQDATRIAFTGYDVTTFLLQNTDFEAGRASPDRLRSAPRFSGLALRIGFDGGQINRELFYHRYRDGNLTLIR